MKYRQLIPIIVAIAFKVTAFGQDSALSNIPVRGVTPQDFVPSGYDPIDTATGDLNKDGISDLALVIANKGEDSFDMDEEPKRILLVLLQQKNEYRLAGKSSEVIMCRHCGGVFGDPFDNIVIERGVLHVVHYGGSSWRWSEDRKFRFQNDAFYLIGSTSNYYWNISDCDGKGVGDAGRKYRDVNWVTGDEEVIERDENCKLKKQEKHKLKRQALVKLESFKYEE